MSLILVAAVQFEALPSLEVFRNLDLPVEFFELGIGPINAAKSAAKLANKCKDKNVLYIGSCGSFYPFQAPHLITVEKIFWMPPCVRTGIAGHLDGLHPPYSLKANLALPVRSVLTSPSISLIDEISTSIAANLPSRESLVENMELYACFSGLQQARSLRILLGVSNAIGPQGRIQWQTHFKTVAKMTAEFILEHQTLFKTLCFE